MMSTPPTSTARAADDPSETHKTDAEDQAETDGRAEASPHAGAPHQAESGALGVAPIDRTSHGGYARIPVATRLWMSASAQDEGVRAGPRSRARSHGE